VVLIPSQASSAVRQAVRTVDLGGGLRWGGFKGGCSLCGLEHAFHQSLNPERTLLNGFEFGPILWCHSVLEQEQLGVAEYYCQGIVNLHSLFELQSLFE
jgi:hypothetical protein